MKSKMIKCIKSEKFLKKIASKVLKKLNFGINLRFEGGGGADVPVVF